MTTGESASWLTATKRRWELAFQSASMGRVSCLAEHDFLTSEPISKVKIELQPRHLGTLEGLFDGNNDRRQAGDGDIERRGTQLHYSPNGHLIGPGNNGVEARNAGDTGLGAQRQSGDDKTCGKR